MLEMATNVQSAAVQKAQACKDSSRNAIRNGLQAMERTLLLVRRALDDGLPFHQRNTTFAAIGSQLDVACRELSVAEEILEEAE